MQIYQSWYTCQVATAAELRYWKYLRSKEKKKQNAFTTSAQPRNGIWSTHGEVEKSYFYTQFTVENI